MLVGVGFSTQLDSREAISEALKLALAKSGEPDFTCVFFSGDYDAALLLTHTKELVGSSNIIGASVLGVFNGNDFSTHGVGVMTYHGVEAKTHLVSNWPDNPYQCGLDTAAILAASGHKDGTVLILPSGYQKHISVLLRGLYSGLGPEFSYIGGGSGSYENSAGDVQFTESGICRGGLAVAVINNFAVSSGVGHGWMPCGSPMIVTRAKDNIIYEFDGQPAVERFKNLLQIVDHRDVDHERLRLQHPLGIPLASGGYLLRDLVGFEGDALIYFTEVPQNSVASLMTVSVPALPIVAKRITEVAVKKHRAPAFGLVFDCFSRKKILEASYKTECQNIQTALTTIPLLGAITIGEINTHHNTPLFHNKLLSVVIGGSAHDHASV